MFERSKRRGRKQDKMKLLVVFVMFALAAIAAAKECTPDTSFKVDCNTCICSKDGKIKACTDMVCSTTETGSHSDNAQPEQICKPRSKFKYYCKKCECAPDGLSFYCPNENCDPNAWNKNGTLKLVRQESDDLRSKRQPICQPGSIFKRSCNTCLCSDDGTNNLCTIMLCPEDQFMFTENGSVERYKRQDDEINKQSCIPGSVMKNDGICNICICNVNGTGSACTQIHCTSSLMKTMEEEEKWGPVYTDGTSCLPGNLFYSECNVCVCKSDGKSAYCTLFSCT